MKTGMWGVAALLVLASLLLAACVVGPSQSMAEVPYDLIGPWEKIGEELVDELPRWSDPLTRVKVDGNWYVLSEFMEVYCEEKVEEYRNQPDESLAKALLVYVQSMGKDDYEAASEAAKEVEELSKAFKRLPKRLRLSKLAARYQEKYRVPDTR